MEIKYKDGYFRLVLGAMAAHIIVMYNIDKGFFEALFTISYLRGFIGSWIIAMLLIQYVYYVTVRLDRKYDWHNNTLLRLLWQLLVAFGAPSILAFLLAAFFFWVFDRNIFQTSYLSQDYTLVVLMILVINIYYFGLHSFLLHRLVTRNVNRATESPSREILIVDTPTRSIPVKIDTAAYFFILGGAVFMRTFEMSSLSQSYQIGIPLKNLEELLNKRMFFRINRRMIVNFNTCDSYKQGKNKTLELVLSPVLYEAGAKVPSEHERLSIVSEDRVAAFRLWMDR
ncbi:LytTR family transcriptional regulator [Flavobacterium zepuense]|uniref:LytTR family transcriptional regulator n=1 Tax=Flavobacterium zepuense TaxID=2593302 RepID=A0A552UTL6_9FLAO|nr:LytTR family transcriptional regulator DNA-binding domain-containing protein [Flavobacterium zepuense]TRW21490.1 LytTR family transcriptional regulator [Flavobacterium zepuense]